MVADAVNGVRTVVGKDVETAKAEAADDGVAAEDHVADSRKNSLSTSELVQS